VAVVVVVVVVGDAVCVCVCVCCGVIDVKLDVADHDATTYDVV
jgi:hypothetical protein